MNHVTTQKYAGMFETLFLTRTLPPWYSNALKRLTKTPKLHFVDPGLLAALQDLSPDRLRADRAPFGALLETFVFAELLKLASWTDSRLEFFHFRDKERHEVDVVMEDSRGRVVGVEVKASATATGADFGGLRKLSEACGERFALGLVLYDHDKVVPFGDRLFAAPISSLWR
jgi:predicted AAA+ superfamily ATPase